MKLNESVEFALRTSVTIIETLEKEHNDDKDLIETLANLKSLLISTIESVAR